MSKSEAIQQYKELEKKVKSLEADLIQMQEDLSSVERAKRAAETERDDLQVSYTDMWTPIQTLIVVGWESGLMFTCRCRFF